MTKTGANFDKPPLRVSHKDLERVSDSEFRSQCPVCEKGVLMVARDQTTFRLINVDRCIWCAQTVVYTDSIIGGESVVDKESN